MKLEHTLDSSVPASDYHSGDDLVTKRYLASKVNAPACLAVNSPDMERAVKWYLDRPGSRGHRTAGVLEWGIQRGHRRVTLLLVCLMLPLESPLYLSMLASEDRRQEVGEIVPGSIQPGGLVGVEIPLT